MEGSVAINPRKLSAAKLIAQLDDLSLVDLEDLKKAESDGRARKSVLQAVGDAIEAHEELADRLDEIVEESSPPCAPLAIATGVYQDRLGYYASHHAIPGFEKLRFGRQEACREALAARLAG